MATAFAFDSAQLDQLNSGTYCVFPVSAIPSRSNVTSGNVSSVPGFVSVILTGRQTLATGLVFNAFNFPYFNYTVDTVGFCLARLVGSSPSPSDRLVAFSAYRNALDQDIVTPPGAFANSFNVDAIKGLLELVSVYRYTSANLGIPAPATFPLGLIYLAGTRNNTVTFANPVGATKMQAWRAADGSNLSGIYDRATGNDGQTDHILDMRLNRIRLGKALVRGNTNAFQGATWWGSNTIDELSLTAANTPTLFADSSKWTQLTTGVTIPANTWVSSQSNDNQTFWNYLKFSTDSNIANAVTVIEFGESTFQSTTVNMVP
jgi:hypothetical protein